VMKILRRACVFYLALAVMSAAVAYGRAGGGEGFGGGGDFGGGGGFGGGGFGGGGFGFGHGGGGFGYGGGTASPIGVLFFIGLIIVVCLIDYLSHMNQGEIQLPGVRRPTPDLEKQCVEALRTADPAFDPAAFYARVAAGFVKTQSAWSAQDLRPVRPFVSDGVHERFDLQFMEQKDADYRNVVKNVVVRGVGLAQVRTEGGFDVATVSIAASALDVDESLTDGRVIRGAGMERFVEYWSFLRRRGSQSVAGKAGLMEGNCPNCGAAVEINAGAKCTSCGALLREGQYDWVLADITQESQWHTRLWTDAPGVAGLRQRDPEFSAMDLQDRASVMFWRWAMADRLGRADPLRKIAAAEIVQECEAHFRRDAAGGRTYWGDRAVGIVETSAVVGAWQNDWERAMVRVRWEGQQFVTAVNRRPQGLGPRQQHTSMMILGRKRTWLRRARPCRHQQLLRRLPRAVAPVAAENEVDADHVVGVIAGADLIAVGARDHVEASLKAAIVAEGDGDRGLKIHGTVRIGSSARQLSGESAKQTLGDHFVVISAKGQIEAKEHVEMIDFDGLIPR
jgi:hypothetical protein